MSVETSLPWPSSIPELKRLDELLRCGICYEFMSTSMVTVCSHNYCSLCIRQYLGYKTQCPACFQETTCQQLRNNRLLDEIISLFPGLRDKTARQCQSLKGNSISGYLVKDGESSDGSLASSSDVNSVAAFGGPSSPDVRGGTKERDVFSSPSKLAKELLFSPRSTKNPVATETPKRGFSNTPMKSPLHTLASPSAGNSRLSLSSSKGKTPGKSSSNISASQSSSSSVALTQSGLQSVSGFFSINDRTTNNANPDEPRVACPVCNVQVPERNINLHLDACLKRMEEGEKEEIYCVKQVPKRKPMPKLVYSLLNEKQMRQKLKEIGLSVQGDRQQLVNRHKRYTILYNAECDVSEPRPIPELLRQVEREEREETKGTLNKSIFTYDRKTAPEIIEKEQVTYLKKNDNHFSKLIADVKRRQEEAKKKRALKEESLSEEKQIVPGTSKASSNNKQNARERLASPGTSKASSSHKQNARERLASPGTSKSKPINSRNNGSRSNHHMLSSSDDDSDSEIVEVKASTNSIENKNSRENKNSLLNFFQNSPKKSSPVREKAVNVSHVKLPRDRSKNVTSSEEGIEDFFENGMDDMLFTEANIITKLPTKESGKCISQKEHATKDTVPNENDDISLSNDKRITNHLEESSTVKPLPNKNDAVSLSIKEMITNHSLTHKHSVSSKTEAESIDASPDIFATSQTNSDCSDASESLLRDQEDMEEDLPATIPFASGKSGYDIDDEELIPGHQPESCPMEDLLLEGPTSPQVGQRTTRSSSSSSQKQQQDLSALGPETQYFSLEMDSQLDPEYKPSQDMEDLDVDDCTPETSKKPTRRSTRKRQVNEEGAEVSKRRRKRK